MTTEKLGTLERVDLRQAFSNEAQNFTPWLAKNLKRLSAELGIPLELEGQEVGVGSYRADIVARVSQTDDRVLIENQLELADLQHLGQLLAYLAGLEAKLVVWIAKGFRDEHLSAIRWLNEHTVDPFAFFAVKISVVQIDDSPLAPVFEVVERPNEWDRQVQESTRADQLSELGKFRRDFWKHVIARWHDAPVRPGVAGSYVWHRVEEANLNIYQYVSGEAVGIYLRPDSKDSEENFEALVEQYREIFESEIEGVTYQEGGWWCWKSLEGVNTRDRTRWDGLVDWLDETRQKYEEILRSKPCLEE